MFFSAPSVSQSFICWFVCVCFYFFWGGGGVGWGILLCVAGGCVWPINLNQAAARHHSPRTPFVPNQNINGSVWHWRFSHSETAEALWIMTWLDLRVLVSAVSLGQIPKLPWLMVDHQRSEMKGAQQQDWLIPLVIGETEAKWSAQDLL